MHFLVNWTAGAAVIVVIAARAKRLFGPWLHNTPRTGAAKPANVIDPRSLL